MEEDRYLRITVEPMDALPEVLAKVRTHAGRPVFLTIPAASPLFLTASEFRALRETVRSSNANLVVISDDRQRQDFARLFNLVPAENDEAAIAWLGAQSSPRPPAKAAVDPALGPPRSVGAGTWRPRAESAAPPPPPVVESPPPAAPVPPEPPTMALVPVSAPVPLPEPASKRKRRRWPWLVSLLLLFALLAGAAAWLPQATVTLTRERAPLTTLVPIIVTEPGETIDDPGDAVVIAGEWQTMTLESSTILPATGERAVPDQPARGSIAFANTSSSPVTLAAGTEFTSDGGVVFALDAEVTIPAADDNRSGNADGTVTAVEGGTAGNLGQGVLSGRHDSGVFFSNRNGALTGGTDRYVIVISEADMDAAAAALEAQTYEGFADAMLRFSEVPLTVVPGSITHSGITVEPEYEVGAEVNQFLVRATTVATGLVFEAEIARQTILDAKVADFSVPDGQFIVLDDAEVTYTASPDGSPNEAVATLLVWHVADLDDATTDGLADDLARTTVDEAEATASAIPGVESVSIQLKPDWLPDIVRERMPIVPQRIEVVEE